MSMRDWMNENSTVVTIGAVALLVIALVVLVTQTGGGPRGVGDAWYEDTVTGEIFRGSADEYPPITSEAGNPAVRAYRFSCGACTEDEMFVGYYEKYTDEAREALILEREEQEELQRQAQQQQEQGQDGNPYAGLMEQQQMQQQAYTTGVQGQLYSVDGENWVQAVGGGATLSEIQQQVHERCDGGRAERCDP